MAQNVPLIVRHCIIKWPKNQELRCVLYVRNRTNLQLHQKHKHPLRGVFG